MQRETQISPMSLKTILSVCSQDPNTGVAMFESAYIVDYLAKTYGMPASSL